MTLKKIAFLTTSILIALGVLSVLLIVATASTGDRLRLASNHISYLEAAAGRVMDTVEQANQAGMSDTSLYENQLKELDTALVAGGDALLLTIGEAYQPNNQLSQVSWAGISALNWQDADTPISSDAANTLEQANQLSLAITTFTNQLTIYREEQTQFAAVQQRFKTESQQLLRALRQQGKAATADTIYVLGNKIEQLLTSRNDEDLDQVFELNGRLEGLEASISSDLREQLRNNINSVYTLNALKRSVNEAVKNMNATALNGQLELLDTIVSIDQQYVSGAVSDARILLNISTVLLLSLLAFFGRRLQSSYAALNASHDDLEERVVERTSDLARAMDDLKESQVQLVQAEKMSSLGQLVAGVMHEINTPLLYVQNNTTMTSDAVSEVSEFVNLTLPLLNAKSNDELKETLSILAERRDHFDSDEIQESLDEVSSLATDSLDGLQQISELVQSLKDFSRLDLVADDKFDVRNGIEKTLVITRNLLKQGVEVSKDFQDVPEIYCSPSRLNQVFINLVTNAVQAMDGEGTLSIETRCLQSGTQDESVEISFEDTGCGIADEHLSKIMDPFFTTKPVGQGTGLGLSIVRQIVEQHNGQIFIDSQVGVGTRITLNFPTTAPSANQDEEAA